MASHFRQILALSFTAVSLSNAATYGLSQSLQGRQFLNFFSFQAIPDPTHGRVNYVTEGVALAKNLTFASDDTFIIRCDFTSTLNPSGPGRDSVRIQSNTQYSTHVVTMDLRHMPNGCATWPAVWEVGDDWPNNGEVDIIEGINGKGPNQATLHTSPGCTMPSSGRSQTGTIVSNDCQGNGGCGVRSDRPDSFAANFNSNGGGWYAMERTDFFISVWLWGRKDGSVPADVRNGASFVNTDNWGTPFAHFPNTQCDLASKFGPNNIVINLTLCGDWAGALFASQCGGDCTGFVNTNPYALRNAFFNFASMHVYE